MTWNTINWRRLEIHVIKQQLRILEAYHKKDYEELEKRELDLIRSFAARALSVKRVTSNSGSETPGVDNVSYKSDDAKLQGALSLKDALPAKYQAQPVKRVMIEKPGSPGRLRPLGIPTVYDRSVQALYSLALEPIAKQTADANSFGFQEGLGTWDAITKLEQILLSQPYPKMVYEGDIQGFFDNISHTWILDQIPLPKAILTQFLTAGYLHKGTYHPTSAGVPQGGIISPMIANMVLDGLESCIKDSLVQANIPRPLGVEVIRYADDFIITGPNSPQMSWVWTSVIYKSLTPFLAIRGLTLNTEKSVLTDLTQTSATFLGVEIQFTRTKDTENKSLSITPSVKKCKSIIKKISTYLATETGSTDTVIKELNPVIRGWSSYFRHAFSNLAFNKLDSKVWLLYYAWLVRKYPKTPWQTLYSKHYIKLGGPRGQPQARTQENGENMTVVLCKFQDTKCVKYNQIRTSPSVRSKLEQMSLK